VKGTYLLLMHHAAAILFAVAVIVFGGSLISVLLTMFGAANGYVGGADAIDRSVILGQLLVAFQLAAWPFFGAALIYRIDRWMEAAK
jgi:hypothetical protein